MKTLRDITADAVEEFDKNFTREELWGNQLMVFLNEGSPVKLREFLESIIERTAQEAIGAVKLKKKRSYPPIGNVHSINEPYNEAIDEAAEREWEFLQNKI